MRDVAILGVGMTKFGELWDRSFREIGIEAGFQALVDAKLSSGDLGALYLGNMASGSLIDQEHIAPLILDYSGLGSRHLEAVRVEGGGASGALALHQGWLAVASGAHDFVVVGGAEKLTDVPDTMANAIAGDTADHEWEAVFGATLPSLWAMMARRHMHEYGTQRTDLASVAVHAHEMASKNPNAHYRNRLSVDQVVHASPVAEPLGRSATGRPPWCSVPSNGPGSSPTRRSVLPRARSPATPWRSSTGGTSPPSIPPWSPRSGRSPRPG